MTEPHEGIYTFMDCPDRIVHETTSGELCTCKDNKPPYFNGFQYCDWNTEHRFQNVCHRGYVR